MASIRNRPAAEIQAKTAFSQKDGKTVLLSLSIREDSINLNDEFLSFI